MRGTLGALGGKRLCGESVRLVVIGNVWRLLDGEETGESGDEIRV